MPLFFLFIVSVLSCLSLDNGIIKYAIHQSFTMYQSFLLICSINARVAS